MDEKLGYCHLDNMRNRPCFESKIVLIQAAKQTSTLKALDKRKTARSALRVNLTAKVRGDCEVGVGKVGTLLLQYVFAFHHLNHSRWRCETKGNPLCKGRS